VVLLLLAGTGIVLWWPGVKHWSRPFRVDFRRKWTRINFDLHLHFSVTLPTGSICGADFKRLKAATGGAKRMGSSLLYARNRW